MKYIKKAGSVLLGIAAGYGYAHYTKNKAAASALEPVMSHSDVFDPSALNGQVSMSEITEPNSPLFHFLFGPKHIIFSKVKEPVTFAFSLKKPEVAAASTRTTPN